MEQDTITMHEIFNFEKMGVGPEGQILGEYRPTGLRPKFLDRILRSGYKLSTDIFGG
jgi:pilus assembly protein CpaF